MLVNTQLKKDVQKFLEPYTLGSRSRKSTHFKTQPSDVSRDELSAVLSGAENVSRRVIRGIAHITNRPVSAYLVK